MKSIALSLLFGILGIGALSLPSIAADEVADSGLPLIERSLVSPPAAKLSDEQMKKIHDIHIKYEDLSSGRKVDLMLLHRKLMDLLSQATVKKSALKALQAKVSTTMAAEANDRIQMAAELHNVLNTEQLQLLRKEFLSIDSHIPPEPPSGLLFLIFPPPPMMKALPMGMRPPHPFPKQMPANSTHSPTGFPWAPLP